MAVGYELLRTGPGEDVEDELDQPIRLRRDGTRRRFLPSRLPISRSRLVVLSFILLGFAAVILFAQVALPDEQLRPTRDELDAGYFETGDVWAHNSAVSARLDRCASFGLLRNTSTPHSARLTTVHPESTYTAAGCGLNATTLIIVSSVYFAEAYNGATFGESIWAQSVMTALNRWGYSFMFSSLGWWNHDMAKTMEIYAQYSGQVRLVVADPEQVVVCFGEQKGNCLRSEENPGGMEEWRFLGFNFWDTNDPTYGPAWTLPDHPRGPHFTLSPAPAALTSHFSLPYSIEPSCRQRPHQSSARLSQPRAYLMAKKTSYLSPIAPSFPWTLPALAEIASELDVQIAVGLSEDDAPATGKLLRESAVVDLGKLNKEGFMGRLSESFVLIGAGRPFISPSPWDGLCLGVPFINPILAWDENDLGNRTSWKMQHGHMTDLNPPYVYSVHSHDHQALREAMLAALENPIDSYIPGHMTFDAVSGRVGEMVERDWERVWKEDRE